MHLLLLGSWIYAMRSQCVKDECCRILQQTTELVIALTHKQKCDNWYNSMHFVYLCFTHFEKENVLSPHLFFKWGLISRLIIAWVVHFPILWILQLMLPYFQLQPTSLTPQKNDHDKAFWHVLFAGENLKRGPLASPTVWAATAALSGWLWLIS